MTRIERLCLEAAQVEASKLNAVAEFDHHRGKHNRIKVTFNDRSICVTLCSTPRSGDNQKHWIVQHVRRIVREISACNCGQIS